MSEKKKDSKFIVGETYYYKGKSYSLIKEETHFVTLKDSTSEVIAMKDKVYTPEEFAKIKDSRRSTHQNWIGP